MTNQQKLIMNRIYLSCLLLLTLAGSNLLQAQCIMQNPTIDATACNNLNEFDVVIDFEWADGTDSFMVVGNGNNYGTYSKFDLPITISNPFLIGDNTTVYEFIMYDTDLVADCSTYIGLGPIGCGPMPLCEITNLSIEAIECDLNGVQYLLIDFDYENATNDYFDILDTAGNNLGYFPLSDLPMILEYNNSNVTVIESLQVCINDTPDCCMAADFLLLDCPLDNCTLGEPQMTFSDCDDMGNFYITLDFEYQNTNDSFDLSFVPGDAALEPYAYIDLPIELGPFNNNDFQTFMATVYDQGDPNCTTTATYSYFCNAACEIWDIIAEATPCDNMGLFDAVIDFNYNNTNSTFTIVGNGNNYGTFSYTDLPITLTDLEANGMLYEFIVADSDQPDCGGFTELEAPNCGSNDCQLSDFIAEAWECDGDGNFLVDIDFSVNNNISDSFHLLISSPGMTVLMTYAYSDLYLTVGPFTGDGSTYTFSVWDIADELCTTGGSLESEDCDTPTDCEISNLDVYPLTCNPDGSYSVLILFDYENVNADNFDVYASNGDFIGSYLYDDLPVTIPSFPASGNANDVLTVCNNDSDQCCAISEFEALDCGACEIVSVLLEEQACDTDLNFMISLDLEIQNGGALGFLVLGNGTNYGAFDYGDLPIELGPFDGDGITSYEFIVVDIANTSCTGSSSIGPIDCQEPPQIWPGDVNLDNISNHFDLLNIGIAYGEMGPERAVSDIDWMSFEGEDWAGAFANGVNWKHADCNGDGEINNTDLTAIEANYDETHGAVIPYQAIDVTPGSPYLFIDLPDFDEITLGEAFVAPIVLGDQDTPIDQIYAIAFTIEYDPEMMDEAEVYVETGSSWLGEQNTQLISIDRSFANEGIIEVAITRTDHEDTAGFGTISYFIGIIDDIAGKSELEIEITNVVAITYEEARISLDTPTSIIDLTTSLKEETLDSSVTVFPNPVQETLNIFTNGAEKPTQIKVYNTLGQLIEQINSPSQKSQMDVNNWNPGIYFLDIQFEHGSVNRKVEVLK